MRDCGAPPFTCLYKVKIDGTPVCWVGTNECDVLGDANRLEWKVINAKVYVGVHNYWL